MGYNPSSIWEPNQWDRSIMETYPFYCPLPIIHHRDFDNVIEYYKAYSGQENFTWKGPKFFFKLETDAILFKLRWPDDSISSYY